MQTQQFSILEPWTTRPSDFGTFVIHGGDETEKTIRGNQFSITKESSSHLGHADALSISDNGDKSAETRVDGGGNVVVSNNLIAESNAAAQTIKASSPSITVSPDENLRINNISQGQVGGGINRISSTTKNESASRKSFCIARQKKKRVDGGGNVVVSNKLIAESNAAAQTIKASSPSITVSPDENLRINNISQGQVRGGINRISSTTKNESASRKAFALQDKLWSIYAAGNTVPIPFLRATDISPISLLSDNVVGAMRRDNSETVAVEALQELFTGDGQSKKGRRGQNEMPLPSNVYQRLTSSSTLLNLAQALAYHKMCYEEMPLQELQANQEQQTIQNLCDTLRTILRQFSLAIKTADKTGRTTHSFQWHTPQFVVQVPGFPDNIERNSEGEFLGEINSIPISPEEHCMCACLTGSLILQMLEALAQQRYEDEEETEEGETTDGWEEEDEAEPELGDGGDGGGVVLQGVSWGERALSIAHEVLLLFGNDIKLYAFKNTPRGYVYHWRSFKTIVKNTRKKLDEVGAQGEIPDDLALEVSTPSAERILKVPDDLSRFKDLPVTVCYEDAESDCTEKDGVFLLENIEIGFRELCLEVG
ncbi:hypothetical protein Patl1_16701 [Pistacia atlantica]|uniref:Uncharacterized protein n=1 Tax=Pistacia atlantica TaxID=434234 RepID=A0ACC1B6G9_9ROSI|nr:hypothetical protein Patl1_16701 [Pistacia atlantica]